MSPQGTFGTGRLHSELWDWGVKNNFIDQIGQNVQIMKRTYKSNHLYEVYSTLTCYKLKDNPTGSSNWLVSGKSYFQIKWQNWKTH